MGTTIVGTLTAEQMQQEAAKQKTMADAAAAPTTERKFQFFAAFDGTNNDKDNLPLSGSAYQTNVANLFDQAGAGSKNGAGTNLSVGYYRGVGTGGEMGGLLSAGILPSDPVKVAAEKAYADFSRNAIDYLKSNPSAKFTDISVAAVGFSRGTASAVLFAQILHEKGLQDSLGNLWAPPGSIPVDALALIDPVKTFVQQGLGIPPNVGDVLQITAQDEFRTDFAVIDFCSDGRVANVSVRGNHVGMGGGYDLGGTAANVREGLTGYFQKSGFDLAPVPAQEKFNVSANATIYTEAFRTAANGDVLTDENNNPLLQWRMSDTSKPRPTVLVAPGVSLSANGSETNLYNLTTNNTPTAGLTPQQDAASGGASSAGTGLVADLNFNASVNFSLLGDVNTAGGNTAVFNYGVSDGLRPGNGNLGLNINASSGQGLKVPTNSTILGDYSLYGADLNNAAAANFQLIPTDPLVLDLNGDGVKLTNYTDAPVLFDADNDGGSLEQTGWVSSADGIVVHDLNGDGKINNMGETLSEYYNGVAGSGGVAGTKPYANGFAALKRLDNNSDNQFTALDAAWNNLRVWVDANHDGKTDAAELKTFAQLGITAINLATTTQSGEVRDGNEVLARGSFTQGGKTKEAIAANFLANPAGSTMTQTGSGITVATESVMGGAGSTGTIKSFVSQNTVSTVNETLSASTLNVRHLTGGAGADTLTGDAQANWLAGGLGADKLYGGAGDDVLLIDANDTTIDGGAGLDIAQVVGSQGVTLNLAQSNIEIAIGGAGNDVFIGGGRSTVMARGGAGDDLIVGGAANDVLSGEDGDDTIDGGAGNDLIRGHRGQDTLLGGAGDDVLDGGLEDDTLRGGTGNDVLIGGRGDDQIEGGDGIDVAQYSGSFGDYRITKVSDANGVNTFRVVDTRTGEDGADTLTNIEKLSFSDVSRVDLNLGAPLPVKDVLSVNSTGQGLSRTAAHLLSKTQLLANDRDWDSDVSQLSITAVLEAKGGAVTLTAQGDVLFTPDASYTGVMGFKYKVQDAQGNYANVTSPTGQTEPMKAAVYLQSSDIPNDPLAVEQWYLADTNVFAAWGSAAEQAAGQGYSGKGVRIGQFEPGSPFSTGPEVFDYRHPDLQPNADKAWLNTLDANGNSNVTQTF